MSPLLNSLFCPLHSWVIGHQTFFLPCLCPLLFPLLFPGLPSQLLPPIQGKQHSVQKRVGSEARQAGVDTHLAWPLSSCVTWRMYLNFPINRNSHTAHSGFLRGLNNQISEKQNLVPGECTMNVVIVIIGKCRAHVGIREWQPRVPANTLQPGVLSSLSSLLFTSEVLSPPPSTLSISTAPTSCFGLPVPWQLLTQPL